MKAEVYIFGNFSNGYSQYPDNYTRNYFDLVSRERRGETEVIYHREGSLTYYIYLREISRDSNTFIGLCYVFNDIIINDFTTLFAIFEDVITNMVVTGELLEFTDDGNLTTKVSQLYSNTKELQRVSDYLNNNLSSLGKATSKLPPANYSISTTEWKNFAFEDIQGVSNVIKDYSNIRIIKGTNYDTESLKGYAAKLKTQNARIVSQEAEIEQLKKENTKIQNQKKQIKVVLLLVVVIAIGLLVFLSKINSQNETIQTKNNEIGNLRSYIDKLKNDTAELNSSLKMTSQALKRTQKDLSKLNEDYSELSDEYNALEELYSDQQQTISQLQAKNSDLERTITNLRNTSSSYGSSTTSSTIGPLTSSSLSGHDSSYALWLYTSADVRINSFKVHASKNGKITIGLYNSNNHLIKSCDVYVNQNQWTKVTPNFQLNANSYYYLAIVSSNGISLGFHRSNNNEYNNYKNGYLQLVGSSEKGKSSYSASYYQYFYEMNYSLR